MKRFVRILLVVAAWAGITWIFREKLLPLPKPDPNPLPHFRSQSPPPLQLAPPLRETSDDDEPEKAPAPAAAVAVAPDDLTEVKGIGPVYQHRLAEIGIFTFADLAGGDAPSIAEKIDVSEGQVQEWIEQASQLAT